MHDAIFVNPPSHELKLLQAPLSVGMLTEIAKADGLDAVLVDLQEAILSGELPFPGNTLALALNRLMKYPSKVYVFSVFLLRSTTFPWIYELSRGIRARAPDAKLVVGGGQVAGMKKAAFEANPWLDVLALGEMEPMICHLVREVIRGGPLNAIPEIIFRDVDGGLVATTGRAPRVDLDRLPMQSFSDKYYGANAQVCIEAVRGCNETCNFCTCRLARAAKSKSPSRLLREIEVVLAKAPKGINHTIVLEAENLAADPRFLPALAEEKRRRNMGFRYACYARLDDLDQPRIRALVESGCALVYVGLESASDRQLKAIRKRIRPLEAMWKIKTLTAGGVMVNANFMIGYPDETLDELEATLVRMAEVRWKGATVSATFIRPDPGSKLETALGPNSTLFLDHGDYLSQLRTAGVAAETIPRPFAVRLWGIKNLHYDLVAAMRAVEGVLYLLMFFPVTTHILQARMGVRMREFLFAMPASKQAGEPIGSPLDAANAGAWLMNFYRPQSDGTNLLYRNLIDYEILLRSGSVASHDGGCFDFDVAGAYRKIRHSISHLDRYIGIVRAETEA